MPRPAKIPETVYTALRTALKAGKITSTKFADLYDAAITAVKLKKDGMTQAAIAKRMRRSTTTIRGLLMSPPCVVQQHGARSHANKKSAKKVEIEKRRSLVAKYAKMSKQSNMRKLPKYPSPDAIAAVLEEAHGIEVSIQTVRNDLIAAGLKCFWRPTRPYHAGHAAARQAFAQGFRKLSYAMRRKTFYCDESVLCGNDATSRTMWATDISKVIPRSKLRVQNIPNISVWAFIGWNFKSKLIIFDKKTHTLTRKSKNGNAGDEVEEKGNVNVTGAVYVTKCLQPNVAKLQTGTLQQDGAASHNSKEVKDYMRDNGIQRLEAVVPGGWPSSSPDFNPIETIWSILKQRICKYGIAKDTEELRDFALRAWDTITIAEVNATIKASEAVIAKHA
jgi:hypothetical protein